LSISSSELGERGWGMKKLLVIGLLTLTFNAFSDVFGVNGYFGSYGAIAYSPHTGAYGKSWNFPTRWEAEQAAMAYCNSWGCRPIVWVVNSCAALAVSYFYINGYGWGVSKYMGYAVNIARRECEWRHGPCYIRASICSGLY